MMKKLTCLLPLIILLFAVLGCGEQSKTEEIKSGRLKFIKKLRYGNVGTHGGRGWYVSGREFQINDKNWSPGEIDVTDAISDCEASPNNTVEVLKCSGFAENNEIAYVLRIINDKPSWETVYKDDYIKGRGNNLGEWFNQGKSLIFKDFFYHTESNIKQEIKGLPDYPANYFRAVSPDLKTILYQGICFNTLVEASDEVKKNRDRICEQREKFYQNKLEVLWLINASTGETKFVEMSREKYNWLIWNQEKFASRKEWLDFFQKQIVWEKDKDGNDRLVYPN